MVVIICCFLLIITPYLHAEKKINYGPDLKIIDIYPVHNYWPFTWYVAHYVVVKNVGDIAYNGDCTLYGCIRGILNPNYILTELSYSANQLDTLLPNEEVTIGLFNNPNIPFIPFFYVVHCEITPEEWEINKFNNIKNNIMFLIFDQFAIDIF